MATKRQILESLNHQELLCISEKFDLSIQNKRRKGNVVDAIVASRTAKLTSVLKGFTLAQLKSACRKLKIEVNGRTKVDFIESLLGKSTIRIPKESKAAKKVLTKRSPRTASGPKKISKKEASKAEQKPNSAQKVTKNAKKSTKTAKTGQSGKTAKKSKTKQSSTPVKAKQKEPSTARQSRKKGETPKAARNSSGDLSQNTAKTGDSSASEAHPSAPDYTKMVRSEDSGLVVQAKCKSCKKKITTVACQANACTTQMIRPETRKICAGCWFDRSGGSFDVFMSVYQKDTSCPYCDKQWSEFDN